MPVYWNLVNSNMPVNSWPGLYERLSTQEFPDSARERWPRVDITHGVAKPKDGLHGRTITVGAPEGSGPGATLYLTVRSDDSAFVNVSGSDFASEADVLVWFRNLLGPQHDVTIYHETKFRFLEMPYGLDVEGMLALMAEASADE